MENNLRNLMALRKSGNFYTNVLVKFLENDLFDLDVLWYGYSNLQCESLELSTFLKSHIKSSIFLNIKKSMEWMKMTRRPEHLTEAYVWEQDAHMY